MTKKIVIIDPFISSYFLTRVCREQNILVCALILNPDMASAAQKAGRFDPNWFDEVLYADKLKPELLNQQLKTWQAEMILPGTEYCVSTADDLTATLGTTLHNDFLLAACRKNKSSILSCLEKNDVSIPKSVYIDLHQDNIAEQLKQAIEVIGFPLFIKPCSSGGSFGIKRCDSAKELTNTVQKANQYKYSLSHQAV